MKKILFILPASIAGALIINGLKEGFKKLGCETLCYDIRELNENEILNFNPDLIIGYDYVHFGYENAEKILSKIAKPIIHYFGDAPLESYSHAGKPELFDKLSSSENIVFCWDKEYINTFKNKAYYLPLAVDPNLYLTEKKEPNDKIVFIGRPLTLKRLELLCEILKEYPNQLEIYCYEKHFEMSIEQIKEFNLLDKNQIDNYRKTFKGFLKTEQDLSSVYAKSLISLNITLDQGINSINYRVFEVIASKGFLINDYKKAIADEFTPEIEAVYYSDKENLMDKLKFYMNNNKKRTEIAEQGYKKLLDKHTFQHRAESILKKISSN
jgi:spore maturation protein CgeB